MPSRSTLTSVGLLTLRVAISGLMLVHGLQKATAFSDLQDKFPDPLGMGSQLSLIAAIGAEVGCSLLLILGLGTRLAAIPLALTMVVALFVVHAEDPWKVKELAAVYLCVYASLILTGAGEFSLDRFVFKRNSPPAKEGARTTS
ncbi:MAG: DoxX family protein [Planctomyces sp.]|nr:DoxX family protein [Planctomyces sp.]